MVPGTSRRPRLTATLGDRIAFSSPRQRGDASRRAEEGIMERSRRLVMGALRVALVPASRAAARLDAMVNALSKAARLRATIDANWDVTQPTGEKIEFGETRVMTIRRPDRMRVETTRRDGTRRVFLFDGTQLAVFDVDLKVYATAPRPGTLDAALEYLTQDLHMRMPLRELFAADLPK